MVYSGLKIVKCPLCGLQKRVYGTVYFNCDNCQITFPLEENQIKVKTYKRKLNYVIVDEQ